MPFSPSNFSNALQFAYKARPSTLDAAALVVYFALRDLDKICRAYAFEFLDYAISCLKRHPPAALSAGLSLGLETFNSRTQFVVQAGKLTSRFYLITSDLLPPHCQIEIAKRLPAC
ncbi:unnamed protein product [Dibothriocephalus latus]|uniref:Uncharacterized protein n=1 Tax=Dibothriocephalus latus TaxID=60516 RepID=A0A3P7LJ39_DIBLA|nr:unnamed protein product [Dibothriocephalus latus]